MKDKTCYFCQTTVTDDEAINKGWDSYFSIVPSGNSPFDDTQFIEIGQCVCPTCGKDLSFEACTEPELSVADFYKTLLRCSTPKRRTEIVISVFDKIPKKMNKTFETELDILKKLW
jgi:hypothetical protein